MRGFLRIRPNFSKPDGEYSDDRKSWFVGNSHHVQGGFEVFHILFVRISCTAEFVINSYHFAVSNTRYMETLVGCFSCREQIRRCLSPFLSILMGFIKKDWGKFESLETIDSPWTTLLNFGANRTSKLKPRIIATHLGVNKTILNICIVAGPLEPLYSN